MRRTLTDKGVQALKPRAVRYAHPDPELVGHYVRVQPGGAKSFVAVARDPHHGKQVWVVIGAADVTSIDQARRRARDAIQRIRAGLPAFAELPDTFQAIAEQWLKRHAQAKRLRSEKQITRLLHVHVYPQWGARPFMGIRRSHVAALLDHVEDKHSARQADCVLTVVRSIMNWYATRHDDYAVPVVKGMRRQNPAEHARDRILSDTEIAAIWKTAEVNGKFGAFVRLALLTAQRKTKVATMKWTDLNGAEWTIPRDPREKDNAGVLVLPQNALDIINTQPQLVDNPHVFAGRGAQPVTGFSVLKQTFDGRLPPGVVAPWTIHDLRRTARSLLSRCGVSSEHAERVMGHRIAGIEGVYDRHSYRDEKADALQRLASLIDSIVNPRENVITMAKGRTKRR
jgi:integrase